MPDYYRAWSDRVFATMSVEHLDLVMREFRSSPERKEPKHELRLSSDERKRKRRLERAMQFAIILGSRTTYDENTGHPILRRSNH